MSISEEMRSLAQGIISSFERRTGEVAALRQGAQREMRELNSARRAQGLQLRAELFRTVTERHQFERQRQAQGQQLRAELFRTVTERHQFEGQRRSRVHAWLGGVRGDRAGAKKAWQEMTTTLQAQRQTSVAQDRFPQEEGPAPPVAEVARKATQIKARPRKR